MCVNIKHERNKKVILCMYVFVCTYVYVHTHQHIKRAWNTLTYTYMHATHIYIHIHINCFILFPNFSRSRAHAHIICAHKNKHTHALTQDCSPFSRWSVRQGWRSSTCIYKRNCRNFRWQRGNVCHDWCPACHDWCPAFHDCDAHVYTCTCVYLNVYMHVHVCINLQCDWNDSSRIETVRVMRTWVVPCAHRNTTSCKHMHIRPHKKPQQGHTLHV